MQAGTTDSDYRGEIRVLLANEFVIPFTASKGMQIAQILIFKLPDINLEQTIQLSITKRDKQGFGSTGLHTIAPKFTNEIMENTHNPTSAVAAKLDDKVEEILYGDEHIKYNVVYSNNPFHNTETINIPIRGKHPMQGLLFQPLPIFDNKIVITGVQPGTTPRNIKQWLQHIKYAHLLNIKQTEITTIQDANNIFKNLSLNTKKSQS